MNGERESLVSTLTGSMLINKYLTNKKVFTFSSYVIEEKETCHSTQNAFID